MHEFLDLNHEKSQHLPGALVKIESIAQEDTNKSSRILANKEGMFALFPKSYFKTNTKL